MAMPEEDGDDIEDDDFSLLSEAIRACGSHSPEAAMAAAACNNNKNTKKHRAAAAAIYLPANLLEPSAASNAADDLLFGPWRLPLHRCSQEAPPSPQNAKAGQGQPCACQIVDRQSLSVEEARIRTRTRTIAIRLPRLDRDQESPLTPTSAWRAAEQLVKVAIVRKSLNLQNAPF